MDFYQIRARETKDKQLELYPDFVVGRSEDLMVQGGKFYAIWDPERNLWSRDEYDVQRLVDQTLAQEKDILQRETGQKYTVRYMQIHGILDGLNGEETVCPGDYIVTNAKGEYYRLSAFDFERQYEPDESVTHALGHPGR